MKCCRRTKVPETDCFAELTVGTNAQTVRFFLARERSDRAFEGTRELPAVEGSMRISPHVSGVVAIGFPSRKFVFCVMGPCTAKTTDSNSVELGIAILGCEPIRPPQ
jgi:hypothetical protein